MSQELARRRPASVAENTPVDYDAALKHLGLNKHDPKAHALVLVCSRYGLDPLLGHVSIYKDQVYIHFAGYLHIANDSPQFEGLECVREWEDATYNYATVRAHRDDRNFPAERTGKSRKIKRKKDGTTYEDDEADAKAFAQAARRALRMAFNVDHPDPHEDHGAEQPAPEPVVEVARIIQDQKSGAGSSGTGTAGDDVPGYGASSPASGDQSGGVGERETSISSVDPSHRHDPTAPDPMSDPPPPPPGGGSDPSSPPRPEGEAGRVGGTNPPADFPEDGDALPDTDDRVGPDVRGDQSGAAGAKGMSDDASGPPPAGPSPVLAWCDVHEVDIRLARVHLKKVHGDEFGDMKDRKDVEELRPPRSDKAIAYLEAQFTAAEEE